MTMFRSILTFYRSFAFVSYLITFACMFIIYTYGIKTYTTLFWFKLITLGLIFFYLKKYSQRDFYYYKNLGVSKKVLWISTLCFDFTMFNILVILTLTIA